MIARRAVPAAARVVLLVSLVFAVLAAPRAARAQLPVALANADGWAGQPQGRERDRILERWAAEATLSDLMYVLRRDSRDLGAIEVPLLERALHLTPAGREDLRARLAARLLPLDSARLRKRMGPLADAVRRLTPGAEASTFRVGLLIPQGESYADFAAAARAGLETALAPTGAAMPAQIVTWNTGEDDPARVGAALDSAALRCGVLVGELLSTPTLLLASGARVWGTPLVSPTATDETIGSSGPRVYQIGPSGFERGERLARAMPLAGRRVGILTSSALVTPFVRGFVETAESGGATIVMRATYAAGAAFRTEVRELMAKKVDVLFWDGEPREAVVLLRMLSREGASMRICGGQALAPEQHHAEAHFLLEGVQYVGDEFVLPLGLHATLDSESMERTGNPVGPVFVRGWLAGRAIRAALDAGALCPEEMATELEKRRMPGEFLRAHGFLAPGVPDLTLPVYAISRGKAIAAGE